MNSRFYDPSLDPKPYGKNKESVKKALRSPVTVIAALITTVAAVVFAGIIVLSIIISSQLMDMANEFVSYLSGNVLGDQVSDITEVSFRSSFGASYAYMGIYFVSNLLCGIGLFVAFFKSISKKETASPNVGMSLVQAHSIIHIFIFAFGTLGAVVSFIFIFLGGLGISSMLSGAELDSSITGTGNSIFIALIILTGVLFVYGLMSLLWSIGLTVSCASVKRTFNAKGVYKGGVGLLMFSTIALTVIDVAVVALSLIGLSASPDFTGKAFLTILAVSVPSFLLLYRFSIMLVFTVYKGYARSLADENKALMQQVSVPQPVAPQPVPYTAPQGYAPVPRSTYPQQYPGAVNAPVNQMQNPYMAPPQPVNQTAGINIPPAVSRPPVPAANEMAGQTVAAAAATVATAAAVNETAERAKPVSINKPETKPEPAAEPIIEETKPELQPQPIIEETKPEPQPIIEETKPEPQPQPIIEETKPEPAAEPIIEETKPEPQPQPIIEETKPEPTAVSASKIKCPGCGADNDNGSKFCAICGTRMSEAPKPQHTFCPQCGTKNDISSKFCLNCGCKLN